MPKSKKGDKKKMTVAEKKKGHHRKRKYSSYSMYIYKVLKQIHPELSISTKAMEVMDSFVHDMLERMAREAGRLARYNKRHTVSSREIQTAVRLLLGPELAKHAVSEGTKAVTKANATQASYQGPHRTPTPSLQ